MDNDGNWYSFRIANLRLFSTVSKWRRHSKSYLLYPYITNIKLLLSLVNATSTCDATAQRNIISWEHIWLNYQSSNIRYIYIFYRRWFLFRFPIIQTFTFVLKRDRNTHKAWFDLILKTVMKSLYFTFYYSVFYESCAHQFHFQDIWINRYYKMWKNM